MMTFDALSWGRSHAELNFSSEGKPIVMCDGKSYSELDKILNEEFSLKDPENSWVAAKIINFLLTGTAFEVITNVEEFQSRYRQQIAAKSPKKNIEDFHTSSYGTYNVEVIDVPMWVNGNVVYYAENLAIGVPYKVTYIPTRKDKSAECHYELLPFLNS